MAPFCLTADCGSEVVVVHPHQQLLPPPWSPLLGRGGTTQEEGVPERSDRWGSVNPEWSLDAVRLVYRERYVEGKHKM